MSATDITARMQDLINTFESEYGEWNVDINWAALADDIMDAAEELVRECVRRSNWSPEDE